MSELTLKANYKIIASLVGAALLVALVVVLSFWAFSQIEASTAARKHTYNLISEANALLSAMKDAETGQRGFSLTGDEAFLEPYVAVRKNLSGQLQELRRLTRIDAARQHLDALVPLVDAKLAEMSAVIELRRNRQMTAVLAAAGGSSQGMQLMNSIRAEIISYIQIEEGALARYDEELRSKMRQLFALIVTASLFTFLLVLSFAYLIYRETQHRLNKLLHVETQQLLEDPGGAEQRPAADQFHLARQRGKARRYAQLHRRRGDSHRCRRADDAHESACRTAHRLDAG